MFLKLLSILLLVSLVYTLTPNGMAQTNGSSVGLDDKCLTCQVLANKVDKAVGEQLTKLTQTFVDQFCNGFLQSSFCEQAKEQILNSSNEIVQNYVNTFVAECNKQYLCAVESTVLDFYNSEK